MKWREFFSFPTEERIWLLWALYLACVAGQADAILDNQRGKLRLVNLGLLLVLQVGYYWLYRRTLKQANHWFELALKLQRQTSEMLAKFLRETRDPWQDN